MPFLSVWNGPKTCKKNILKSLSWLVNLRNKYSLTSKTKLIKKKSAWLERKIPILSRQRNPYQSCPPSNPSVYDVCFHDDGCADWTNHLLNQELLIEKLWSKIYDIDWLGKIMPAKRSRRIGFRDLKALSAALLAKQAWHLLTSSSLVARIFKARYFLQTSIFQATKHV